MNMTSFIKSYLLHKTTVKLHLKYTKMVISTEVRNKAKQDYKTGNYHWFCLKHKYRLSVKEVFDIIFEVRQEKQ